MKRVVDKFFTMFHFLSFYLHGNATKLKLECMECIKNVFMLTPLVGFGGYDIKSANCFPVGKLAYIILSLASVEITVE